MYINLHVVISDTTITVHKYGNCFLNCILLSLISLAWLPHASPPSVCPCGNDSKCQHNVVSKILCHSTDERTLIKVLIWKIWKICVFVCSYLYCCDLLRSCINQDAFSSAVTLKCSNKEKSKI